MSKGILLINLGSPAAPSAPAVRRYLNEFLMDGRVVDLPWLLRRFVVAMILLARAGTSAQAYRSIWTADGSPLIVTSRRMQTALAQRVPVPVELAMRYQQPAIDTALRRLAAQGVNDTWVIPLFPHYAMSSFETAVVRAHEAAAALTPPMTLGVQAPYYAHPDYISALVASAAEYLRRDYDHLLFSYHGIPERHLRKSDPTGHHCLQVTNCCAVPSPAHAVCYRAQCLATTREFVKLAGIPADRHSVSFQSRLGRAPWLTPCTEQELSRLAGAGRKRLLVICPSFIADCLETLEEIDQRGRTTFLAAGGTEFTLLPCLNDHPRWIDTLVTLARAGIDSGTGKNHASAPVSDDDTPL